MPLAIKAEPQSLMIKPEPVEDRISNRKRSGTLGALQEISPKKIKAGPENLPMAGAETRRPPPASAEAIRSELLDLQSEVNRLQPQLDRSKRKSGKSTAQLTREMNITRQLIALYQRRKELTEMLPAVSAHVQPVAGPSFQTGYINGSAQPSQSLTLVQPPVTSVAFDSDPFDLDHWLNPLKDEPMSTDSDDDDATHPPTSDMDPLRSLLEDDSRMLVDGTDLGMDFYHYNTAKADEWVYLLIFQISTLTRQLVHSALNDTWRLLVTLTTSMATPKSKRL